MRWTRQSGSAFGALHWQRDKFTLLIWNILCRTNEKRGAGLRKSEDMNKSLLAKVGWRLLSYGEETMCRVLRNKYGISDDRPVLFKQKQRESNIWKGIVWICDFLQFGLRLRVTNGKKDLFWVDRWTGEATLVE